MEENKTETVSSEATTNQQPTSQQPTSQQPTSQQPTSQQPTSQPSSVASFYNPSFLCEYRATENETQYRKEFLRIFNLDSYDESRIIDLQNLLTDLLDKVEEFHKLFMKASEHAAKMMMAPNMENDASFGLIIMFSYDYLDLFHECVKEYLDNNETVTVTVRDRINAIVEKMD